MFRSLRAFTSFALIVSIISSLYAESTTGHSLSKERAIRIALEQNKHLLAARQTIEQAEARRQIAGKWDDPELSIEYSNDWLFNDEGESTFGIAFEQRFPISKRVGLQKDISDIEIQLARAEIANFERILIRDVELAINDIAHIDAQLGLRHSLVALNTEFANFVESRIETAEASELDANQVKIELYVIEQEIQNLKNERESRVSSLRTLLGQEPQFELILSETFQLLDSALQPEAATLNSLDSHPEYRIRQLLLDITAKEAELALRGRWDDITLGFGFENERSVDEPSGLGTDRFLGVSVSIPLPIRKRYEPAVRENVSRQNQMRAQLEATALELRNQANALSAKALSLYQQAEHYEKSVTKLVERNLEQMNSAYGAGLINLNQLFRSQERRLKIQSAYLTMVHDYQQAVVEWHAATAQNIAKR